ncbi:uncharacterized protein LOC144134890 [Amblyomma americanum]
MEFPPLFMPAKRPPLLLPCTRSEDDPVCQLTQSIVEYNEILWHVGLEIREEDGVGDLGIASPPGIRLTGLWLQEQSEREILAVNIFNDIIAQHLCIVSIELNFMLAINPLVLGILENKRSVSKLVISYIPCIPYWEANVVDVLRKLASPWDKNDAAFPPKCTSLVNMPQFEAPVQRNRTILTTLDVGALKMCSDFAQQLFDMLLQNNTISELTVGASVFTADSLVLLDCFTAYLGKEGSSLTKLTMITPLIPMRGLQSLVTAILTAKALEELVVHTDIYSISCAEQNALFAQIVARNCTMRDFRVTCPRRRAFPSMPDLINIFPGDAASRIDPWISALENNTALSTLALDLVGLSNNECCAFFHSLALNNALKNVHIGYLPGWADIKDVCRIIRESRFAKAVHIEDYVVSARSLSMLPECPELTSLTISCLSPNDIEFFCGAFAVLSSCKHVVSLRVCVERRLLSQAQAAMAAYVAQAHTLKNITVVVFINLFDREQQQHQDPFVDGILADALASNVSLARIEVKDLALSVEKSRVLANAFIKSQNLAELSFAARGCESSDAFLTALGLGIEKNYSLLRVDIPMYKWRYPEVRVIRNVTARNCSLVARAARFVMGDHSDYNAQAIELVSGHASVLNTVQESAGVEAGQAKEMIRRALRLQCLTGLDEYMKLTGVVKRRVECVRRPCDARQLDELDYECWLHIRKFLIVADVLRTDSPLKI